MLLVRRCDLSPTRSRYQERRQNMVMLYLSQWKLSAKNDYVIYSSRDRDYVIHIDAGSFRAHQSRLVGFVYILQYLFSP
jgi:hypothetical protein